ncbi:MAG: hypothetical protein H0Z33_08225 [Bacillaceae bacterium]|nr:hypothetical protein [Bacillaceae bacterium]
MLEVLSDERDDPSQLRTMAIKVEKIFKKPADLNLEVGESLSVTYVYIPKWVARAGSATVDIMPGDQFEIWLEPGERGWQPVLGGNTVEHLYRVQPRQEPIPEPFFHKVERNKMLILRNTLIAFMVVGVVLVMIRAAVLWRRMD